MQQNEKENPEIVVARFEERLNGFENQMGRDIVNLSAMIKIQLDGINEKVKGLPDFYNLFVKLADEKANRSWAERLSLRVVSLENKVQELEKREIKFQGIIIGVQIIFGLIVTAVSIFGKRLGL